ncbi:hypothetical protein [Streptomyces sp. NPDC054863]
MIRNTGLPRPRRWTGRTGRSGRSGRSGKTPSTAWRAGLARAAALAVVVAVVGLLPWLSGRDPALTVLRARSAEQEPTAEALAAVRRDLGLDAGPLALLTDWASGLLNGDLGLSWVSGTAVLPSVLSGLGVSLTLMAASLAVALLVASALCAPTLTRGARGTLRGSGGGVGAMLAALPEFLLATVLLIVFGVWWGLLPVSGWQGPRHLVLPALAMGIPAGGLLGRLVCDGRGTKPNSPPRPAGSSAGANANRTPSAATSATHTPATPWTRAPSVSDQYAGVEAGHTSIAVDQLPLLRNYVHGRIVVEGPIQAIRATRREWVRQRQVMGMNAADLWFTAFPTTLLR